MLAADAAAAAEPCEGDDTKGGDATPMPGTPSEVSDEDFAQLVGLDLFEDDTFAADEEGGREPADEGMRGPIIAGGGGGGGAAGSSGDMPPPLPPPAAAPPIDGPGPAPARRPRGPNRASMAVLFVAGGKLTFYDGGRDTNLVAECSNPLHGRCVRTKTLKGPADRLKAKALAAKKGQGRPVGYLAAWLAKSAGCESKASHWDVAITKPERRAARDAVKADDSVDATFILGAEFGKGADEDSEPDNVP